MSLPLWHINKCCTQHVIGGCLLNSSQVKARRRSTNPELSQCIVHTDAEVRRWQRRRCAATRGGWCGRYERQLGVAVRPPPRGDLPCPNDCSGVGNCNYDIGRCDCPAGVNGCGWVACCIA